MVTAQDMREITLEDAAVAVQISQGEILQELRLMWFTPFKKKVFNILETWLIF